MTKQLRFYDINLPMLATHKVVHIPTQQEVPKFAFETAWRLSTRVSRILKHECDCYKCDKSSIRDTLIIQKFTTNLDDYQVVEL